ncbi:porin [Chondromyces apiculatus]|uniref:porin n=1 Tax=Chondromyces apiculatus TaxID=51 RepID=UPI001E62A30B|nr:porin [Chondromyces apiculatus]
MSSLPAAGQAQDAPAPAPPSLADAPPPPPTPGAALTDAALAPSPSVFSSGLEGTAPLGDTQAAGWHDVFFLRGLGDTFRLYPMARLHLDAHTFFGAGVDDFAATEGGNALRTQFFARRIRFELGGEFMRRLSFLAGVDVGGQPLLNPNGTTVVAAPRPGEDPTLEGPTWSPTQASSMVAVLANTWINYRALPFLNVMLGQFPAPYSLENMTSSNDTLFTERLLPIRAFVFPNHREMGAMLWGELPNRLAVYHLGVFSGDGPNRPGVDSLPAFIGRIYGRPFAMKKGAPLERAQIGVSAVHSEQDPRYVGTDYPRISTGQFITLWDPRYRDTQNQNVRVMPSGAQNAIGGELWLPVHRFDLRAEAHYVVNQTREAIEGHQLDSTERLGRVQGLGWYAALSFWLGDPQVNGEPGLGSRPVQLNLQQDIPTRSGLQLTGVIGGIHANYRGAARGGTADLRTAGAISGPGTDITVMQYGAAATYWYTRHLRLTVNYSAYHTPGSSSPDNLAAVPGNRAETPDPNAHLLHELGTRVGLQF